MNVGQQLPEASKASPHRLHPLQLFRQMEQDEVSLSKQLGDASDNCKETSEEHNRTHFLGAAGHTHTGSDTLRMQHNTSDIKLHANKSPSLRRHDLPITRESQGSSSTSSGTTAMSISTGTGGSASSCQSMRNRYKTSNTRGARCNSSASSSTEETEARERGFGSVDLHPLPTVAPAASGIRRNLVTAHPNQLDFSALLALQQQCMERLATLQTSSSHKASFPAKGPLEAMVSNPLFESDRDAADVSTIKKEALLDLHSVSTALSGVDSSADSRDGIALHSLGALPPSLWTCLVCPVHAWPFLQSCGFLSSDLTKVSCFPPPSSHDSPVVHPHPSEIERHLAESLPANSTTFTSSAPLSWQSPTVVPPTNSPRVGPYELGPTLGRGNFAVVKLARHVQTKVKVAIKIINKELIGSSNLSKVFRELEAMKRCQHPHIVRLYHVMESESSIFMVTEFASEGEVFDHISKSRAFSEKEARELFWQIVCAVDFCHSSGVVHRDLKAENLLLDSESKIKVADFGFCNFFRPGGLLSTHCGSPQYAAPELFKGEPYDGPLADVWSLGVILYILVCGSFPFPGESLGDIRSQVLRGLVRFPFFLSTACEHVIRCMLAVDPARRFSLQQITNTPWMQASPNVAHYQAMIEKYKNKAKDRKFDEIFRSQYPEHGELVQKDEAERSERRLKINVIRALAIGAGFDETQIKSSTLQTKYDRFHAAYQLLRAKILRFKRLPQLRQFVEGIFLAGDRSGRRLSLTNTDKFHNVEMSTTRTASVHRTPLPEVSRDGTSDSSMDVHSDQHYASSQPIVLSDQNLTEGSFVFPDIWRITAEPNDLELNLALLILKLDEDAIMSHLGVPTSHWVSSVAPVVRRHTVQLPTSPLMPSRPIQANLVGVTTEPSVERDVKPAPIGVAAAKDPDNRADNITSGLPPTTLHQFSRQSTQPPLFSSHNRQLRTALQWTPELWNSGTRGHSITNPSTYTEEIARNPATKRPVNMPSLELGQEAATTKPPHLLRSRSTFQRHDSIQESENDEPIDVVTTTSEHALTSTTSPPHSSDVRNPCTLADIPFHPLDLHLSPDACLMFPTSWGHTIRDGACLNLPSYSKPDQGHQSVSGDAAAMETDTTCSPSQSLDTRSGWPHTSIGPDDDNGDVSDAHGLGTLLPQLNLPANLPAMIHQPVARFTVKDPHLLAPPGFMIPHCSSFPRRSSDGAADLQPLHRPVLTVGGSYPEQANYRSTPSASESVADTLANPSTAQTALEVDDSHPLNPQDSECTPVSSTQVSKDFIDHNAAVRSSDATSCGHQSKPHPRHLLRCSYSLGFRLRGFSTTSSHRTPAMLAAQHRTLWSALRATRTATSITRSWWRPPGRRCTVDQIDGDRESDTTILKSLEVDPQFNKYQKRFSLPTTCRLTPLTPLNENASPHLAECICRFPLAPDTISQIRHILAQVAISYSNFSDTTQLNPLLNTDVKRAAEANSVRRGSESSQLLAWKHRLGQYDGLSDLQSVEPVLFTSTEPLQSHDPSWFCGTGVTRDRTPDPTFDPSELLHPEWFSTRCSTVSRLPTTIIDSLQTTNTSSLPLNNSPTTPPGIELNELKTELHKLESEGQMTLTAQDSGSMMPSALTLSQCYPMQPQRLSSPSPSAVSSLPGFGDAGSQSGSRILWSRLSVESPTPSAALTLADTNSPCTNTPRRASSVVSSSLNRCFPTQLTTHTIEAKCSSLDRRHRYSVGDCLNYAPFEGSELTVPIPATSSVACRLPTSLSCQPSITGLHSPSSHYHRSVATISSNPDRAFCFDGFHTPSTDVHVPMNCDLERTALSSPGPYSVATVIDFSTTHHSAVAPHCPTESAPSSTGVKRRLLTSMSHQKQQQPIHDYLRGLQHSGGSLDRRLNLDLFTSPRRKIYHDWLPKIAAFSRKAAATVFQAVNTTQRMDESHSSVVSVDVPAPSIPISSSSAFSETIGSTLCPSASGPTRSSTGVSLVSICQASDVDDAEEEEEEERACELGPLQSQYGFVRGSTFQSSYPPADVCGTWGPDPSFYNPSDLRFPTPFMFMAPGDDGDDLAEIERVNQQLAMSGGIDAMEQLDELSLPYGCPSFHSSNRGRPITTLMPSVSEGITVEHVTSQSSPSDQPSS